MRDSSKEVFCLEPLFLGYPVTLLILYFITYSFCGWLLETIYCSVKERKLVPRGFLHGPLCPIYGGGVLLMILFFTPLSDNIPLFYVVSVVTMSAWEYLVAWLLETATHIKYWDYSDFKFNFKGRICLQVCLTWGVLAYLCIFWIHPLVSGVIDSLPDWLAYCLTGAFAALLLVDVVDTIRGLAQTTVLMNRLEAVAGQLQLKLSLGKLELDESVDKLKQRYNELLDAAEWHSRRFRRSYTSMTSKTFAVRLEEVKQTGADVASRVKESASAWREERRKKG